MKILMKIQGNLTGNREILWNKLYAIEKNHEGSF